MIFKTIVGDSREHLTGAASLALSRAEIVIFMGGLGPTEDDLTREAVADALGLELRRDPEIVAGLERRFAARGWKNMSANNLKQADVIAGAVVLPNANGSAPGQWISGRYEGEEKIIMLLPGPPHELQALFDEQCMDRLRAKLPPQFIATRVLKIAMMAESQCDARVAPIYKRYTDVQTTILAGAGEIQLHLKTRALFARRGRKSAWTDWRRKSKRNWTTMFFPTTEIRLSRSSVITCRCAMPRWRWPSPAPADCWPSESLRSAAARVTSWAERWFTPTSLKTAFADVPAKLIEKHGAVSGEVAAALAEGIRKRCGSTLGIGITGVAGPAGGTPEKPVGLVFLALASEKGTEVAERNFPGDRKRIRWFASQLALDMIRRKLM